MGSERIQAISFDVGGTLIEPWPSVGHVYAEVAARFGITDAAPGALNQRFAAAWKARRDFDYSKPAWRALVEETFRDVSATPPGAECFEAIYQHFAGAAPWRMFDDVLPTLKAARERGLKLAVVSNWDNRLQPLLWALGLGGHFEAVIHSCNPAHTKPAPAIFHLAVRALGLAPGEVLHIGDSREEDFEGARAAGLQALWLDRSGRGAREGAVGTLAAALENDQ